MNDLKALVLLNMVKGMSSLRAKKLLEVFGSPQEVLNAGRQALIEKAGVTPYFAQAVASAAERMDPDKEIRRAEAIGARILSVFDDDYPALLKCIPDPPCVLYVKGDLLDCDENAVALVGSRGASFYGLSCARKFSSQLSEYGLTIVSGMARGVDTAAHRAALDCSGRTIAVLGSGLNMIYPPENETLFKQISLSGAVVSQFPLDTPPMPQNFPVRNRIISGLSKGVLVIEASAKSGALITARCASEQGREVFAIPGAVSSPNAGGVNGLIKDGAKLVTDPSEILEELKPLLKIFAVPEGFEERLEAGQMEASQSVEDEMLKYLDKEPRHVDYIARQSGLSVPEILAILTQLELKGMIRQIHGKSFCISSERVQCDGPDETKIPFGLNRVDFS